MTWSQTFGGAESDDSYSVQPTADGGYIIAGFTFSFGIGDRDVYLVKTDASGNMTWSQTFGGAESDGGYSVQPTADGGYIITGFTYSFGAGASDVYLIKTDTSGNMTWSKTIGGTNEDYGNSIQPTTDGGYITTGFTNSFGAGNHDVYLIKVEGVAEPAKDWTFMVYMAADNNLDPAGVDDLNEMEVVGSTDNVNIVVLSDRWGSGDTNIYYVTSDNDTDNVTSPVVPGPPAEVNMGDPNTLVNFVEWTKSNYPADHYALVLWNHGSGWREPAIPEALPSGVAWDDTSGGDYITTLELGSALSQIFVDAGETPLDIVGFDACLMEMAEIACEIEDYISIMVGSEEVEPVDGWPYDTILTELTLNPASTHEALATTIVNQYMASYGTAGIETMSALDLAQVPVLTAAITAFADSMVASGEWDNILTARALTESFNNPAYIDLYDFAGNIQGQVSDNTVQTNALAVMDAVTNAIIAEGHGIYHPNVHGLSIYFPMSGAIDANYYGLAFALDTTWDEFLGWYLTPQALTWDEIISDPVSDQQGGVGPDIVGVDSSLSDNVTIAFQVRTNEAIDFDNFYGMTLLDIDQNPETGTGPWNIGADYAIYVGAQVPRGSGFSEFLSRFNIDIKVRQGEPYAVLYRWVGPSEEDWEHVSMLPLSTDNISYWTMIPLSFLGPDDGIMDVMQMVFTVSPDQWTDVAPNPSGGTISGHVYQSDNTTPIEGALIDVFEYDSLSGSWVSYPRAQTGVGGIYRVLGLPTGQYGVRVRADDYATEWYDDIYYKNEAIPVSVTAPDDTPDIDFSLGPGGSISGHIYQSDNTTPIANHHVQAFDSATNEFMASTNTDYSGNYTLSGLPDGSYLVRTRVAYSALNYIDEWYDGVYELGKATLVTVTVPDDTPGINFVLEIGGTISGTVIDGATSQPIANLHIYATDNVTNEWIAGTSTDASGNYALVVPAGSYFVKACASCSELNYINELYDDVYNRDEAVPVSVTVPDDTPGIDFSLEALVTRETVEAAIADGITWLAAQQNPAGPWGNYWEVTKTALAVLKLETHATSANLSPFDPAYQYSGNITAGLNFLFVNAYVTDVTAQTAGDPDTNGNGWGVYFRSPTYPPGKLHNYDIYETSIAMMAIAASGTDNRTVAVPGSPVDGWTYATVAQDVVDYLAWSQTDSGYGRGGWNYEPMNNQGDRSDQSNSGWVSLGLSYAENFGSSIPGFVRTELDIWIDYIQDDVDGGSYYSGAGDEMGTSILRTGNLLQQMAFVGDTENTTRVQNAITFLVNNWDEDHDPGWRGNPTCYQATYTAMKGLEAFDIETIDSINWYQDFTDALLSEQTADGWWQSSCFDDGERILSTEWALLTLQKTTAPTIEKPDLVISEKHEEWVDKEAGTYHVYFTLKNRGNAMAPGNGYIVKITIDGIPQPSPLIDWVLTPGDTWSGTNSINVTLSGDYDEITVYADASDNVTELNEDNNYRTNTWPGVQVRINAQANVVPDSDFTATVDIGYVIDLNGVQYDILFDPKVLRLDDVTAGQIDSTEMPVQGFAEVNPGRYRVIQSLLFDKVSGSGYLSVLYFHVVGSLGDNSTINLSNGTLSGWEAELPATWIGDFVEVAVIPGDADGNYIVNILDLTRVVRMILLIEAETPGADANQDGVVDVLDLTKIVRIILMLDVKYGGVFTQTLVSDPRYFDEAFYSISMAPTLHLTNEELLTGDWAKGPAGSGEASWLYSRLPAPDALDGSLAESWETIDSQTLVFHVRPGVYFHDKPPTNGRVMTANDVVFSLKRLWETPGSYHYVAYPWETNFEVLDGGPWITATDNWTVEIKSLPGKLAAVYEIVGDYSKIVPPEVIAASGNMSDWRDACGTGPFMLMDYVEGSSATFDRNPDYWMKDPLHAENQLPYLNSIRWYIIPDLSTRLAAIRTGKIDWLGGSTRVSWQDAESLMNTNPDLEYLRYLPALTVAPFMRTDNQTLPLADVRVRRALAMAINQAEIAAEYYDGNAEILTSPISPVTDFMDMYTPLDQLPVSTRELYEYHPDKALELLAEAGYPGPDRFTTTVVCRAEQVDVDILSIVNAYWAAIGVDLVLDVKESAVWRSIGINKAYEQMYMGSMYSSRPFTFRHYRPGDVYNYSMIDDSYLNGNIAEIDAAYFDETLRRQLMKNIVPYVLDQAWILPVPEPYVYTFWQPWVKGYHGEFTVGKVNYYDFSKYIWLDLELKEAMGY
ncbi:clostripain-related cysteine peptidase [Chloroflexota bacterium]